MDHRHVGWFLVITGALLTIAETMAQSNASVSGVPFANSEIGKLEAKIPNPTPFQPGAVLLIAGAFTLWVLPLVWRRDG